MEKKIKNVRGMETKAICFLKAMLGAYVVTGILLLLLSFLLYKFNLDEGKVTAGIIVIYVVSTFVGGMLIGKSAHSRRFLWGIAVGVLYFVLMLLISLGIYHTLQGNSANMLTTFLLCAGGGMLGGMVS